jgi:selenide, water dikinase
LNIIPTPIVKDLVLIGGGHSHISVLRRFGMKPIPGVRVTLICPDVYTPYSGMLPGFVAGHYAFDDIHIDLTVLARFAGARLFVDEVVGIDPENRRIRCANRPDVPYDVASINVGSTPNTSDVPGATDVVVPVKPINRFADRWDTLSANLRARDDDIKIGIVGGGAGGVELALAVSHRLRSTQSDAGSKAIDIHLVTQENDILSSHNRRTAAALNRALGHSGITVHRNFRVCDVRPGAVVNDRHETIELDEVLWATQAAAPAWFRDSGLAVDENGFMAVDATLQSISHAGIFGAGDAASVIDHPRAKSGVFAVRQGRPLTRNLRRVLVGRDPLPFTPQRAFLSLIATGPKRAVASRGAWAAEGQWAWRWKNWIDRRFIRRFSDLPDMAQHEAPSLAAGLASAQTLATLEDAAMRCGGCGAKVSAPVLGRVLARLKGVRRDDVLIGLDQPDDAAVIAVPEGKVLVQSVDSFRAMVEDPYLFGKITANHCLNDIYAMGGEPQTALAIITVPFGLDDKVEDTLGQLLAGASEVLTAANTQLVGGHSGEGAELALGFTVNGLADRARLLPKGGLQPGQRLIITKAIGTGTLFAAEMRGKARGRWIAHATESMLVSNRAAAGCFARHGATSCTDVTGFGVVGHVLEMLHPSGTGLDLDVAALPLLDGATETIGASIVSSLHATNLERRDMISNYESAAHDPRVALLFDPQTAGGLIAGVPADQADACVRELRALGYDDCAAIGTVRPGDKGEKPISLRR